MDFKVVFHIDEPSKWSLLLRNVQNLAAAANAEDARIEVVANAEAVGFYTHPGMETDKSRMRELAEIGVRFTACGNALKGMGIAGTQLPPFVKVVPAGVMELVERQHQGYAYIKP